MQKKSAFLGIAGGFITILLWLLFAFINPYNTPSIEPIFNTFFMLVLPACLAVYASTKLSNRMMIIAFLWSLPLNLYMIATPGIFAYFGISSALYLISILLSLFNKQSS